MVGASLVGALGLGLVGVGVGWGCGVLWWGLDGRMGWLDGLGKGRGGCNGRGEKSLTRRLVCVCVWITVVRSGVYG